jgi:hypothetical protein
MLRRQILDRQLDLGVKTIGRIVEHDFSAKFLIGPTVSGHLRRVLTRRRWNYASRCRRRRAGGCSHPNHNHRSLSKPKIDPTHDSESTKLADGKSVCRADHGKSRPQMIAPLPAIPVIDVRDGGPPRHAQERAAQARALRDACLRFFPRAALPLIPVLDRLSRATLERSRSPYVAEIAQIASALDFSGVWLLNASYQWACTARACEQDGLPWLIRTLDWPFRGLGRHIELAHMRGEAGDFVSVTWPGYVGVLTAVGPRRFAAALNQAPMWRRTTHRWLRPADYAANAVRAAAGAGRLPPDQLLRHVFEVCCDFAAARRLLEAVPVARPAIYTLVGCASHERCVIERTETDFVTRDDETCAANDWVPCRPGWEGRIGTRRFLVSSFADAAGYSRARREGLAQWSGSLSADGFDWLREPVLNPYTRLAVAMSPASGILRVVGYDVTDTELPAPVTQIHRLELLTNAE